MKALTEAQMMQKKRERGGYRTLIYCSVEQMIEIRRMAKAAEMNTSKFIISTVLKGTRFDPAATNRSLVYKTTGDTSQYQAALKASGRAPVPVPAHFAHLSKEKLISLGYIVTTADTDSVRRKTVKRTAAKKVRHPNQQMAASAQQVGTFRVITK